jgi:hypothetical protein
MMKKALFSALLLIMAVLSLHDLAGVAQAVMTPPGKFFPSAQLKKTLEDDKSPQSVVAGQAAVIIPPENFTMIKGGQTVKLQPGDVIVIPPGSAHWFNKISGHITYIQTRFPGNVLARQAK